jgi:hypothetical protein
MGKAWQGSQKVTVIHDIRRLDDFLLFAFLFAF